MTSGSRLTRTSRRTALLLAATLASALAGCHKATTAPRVQGLRPVEQARQDTIVTVTVAPLARTAGRVDAFARKLGLPFTGRDFLTAVAARAGLTLEQGARLHLERPMGVAVVLPPGATSETDPLFALALEARTTGDGDALEASLGNVAETHQNFRRRTRPDGGSTWIVRHGALLVLSDVRPGLEVAGALAMEARREVDDEVVATVHPMNILRWQGGSAKVRARMLASSEENRARPMPVAERAALEASLDDLLPMLEETVTADLAMTLDVDRGVRWRGLGRPRPASRLAARIRPATPYSLPAGMTSTRAGESVAFLWASGPSPELLDSSLRTLEVQARAGVPGAAEVAQRGRALQALVDGSVSVALRTGRSGASWELALPLRAGASPKAVLEAANALVSSEQLPALLAAGYGPRAPTVAVAREGETTRLSLTFPEQGARDLAGTVRALFGSTTINAALAVRDGRLVIASEPGAPDRIAALRTSSVRPEARVADALTWARGRDGFAFVDLWALLRPALGALGLPPGEARMLEMVTRLPGMSNLALPVWFSYRGGETLSGDLLVPISTLESAASILRPLMGLGALGGTAP